MKKPPIDATRSRKQQSKGTHRALFSTGARRHSGLPRIQTNRQEQLHFGRETQRTRERFQPESLRSTRTDQLLISGHENEGLAQRSSGQGAITPILYPSSGLPDRFGSPKREQWRPWATSRVPFARSQSHSRLNSRSQPFHGCPSNGLNLKSPAKEKLWQPDAQTLLWGQEPALAEVSMVGTHIRSLTEQRTEDKKGIRPIELEQKRKSCDGGRRDVSLRYKLRVLKSRNQATFSRSHPRPRPPALLQELAQYITRRTQHEVRNSLAALPMLIQDGPTMSVAVAKSRRKTMKEFLAKVRKASPTTSLKLPRPDELSFGALLPCRGTSYGNPLPASVV
jgi:hypothetical protein